MRELAKIKVISDLQDVVSPDGITADSIQLATIEGWQCVVKRGEFNIGDKCVYFEVDSVLPNIPVFKFMESKKFRVKTMKFNRWGVISQGLALPVNLFPEVENLDIESNVTELLNVTKYELPEWDVKRNNPNYKFRPFPSFIPKTDEARIQSYLGVLDELKGKPYYITIKMNGGSSTFYLKDDKFGICTRNQEIMPEDDYKLANALKNMAIKYDLENSFFRKYNMNITLQGELCGPSNRGDGSGIGNNEDELYFFNVFDIDNAKYSGFDGILWLQSIGLPIVPILESGQSFNYDLKDLEEMAFGYYPSGKLREGIVIRPQIETYSPTLRGRLSFKCISKEFLLGEK